MLKQRTCAEYERDQQQILWDVPSDGVGNSRVLPEAIGHSVTCFAAEGVARSFIEQERRH